MGPASDREAPFFIGLPTVQAQSPGEQHRSLFLWLALQKYGVFSYASQGAVKPLFRSGDDSLLGWLSSLLSHLISGRSLI